MADRNLEASVAMVYVVTIARLSVITLPCGLHMCGSIYSLNTKWG